MLILLHLTLVVIVPSMSKSEAFHRPLHVEYNDAHRECTRIVETIAAIRQIGRPTTSLSINGRRCTLYCKFFVTKNAVGSSLTMKPVSTGKSNSHERKG